jgi:hypothetical protein
MKHTLSSLFSFSLALVLMTPATARANEFFCGGGDVPCLIAAINDANTNGEKNTIFLDSGAYTLTAVDNDTDGPNGLPAITGSVTILGVGADNTIIERQAGSPVFRLIHVAEMARVTLKGLTVRGGGFDRFILQGGGLFNSGGTVRILDSIITGNVAHDAGGGLYTAGGTVTVTRSVFSGNTQGGLALHLQGGGLFNGGGVVKFVDSTIVNNSALYGGGLYNAGGTITLTRSILSGNRTFGPSGGIGGGIYASSGSITISRSTVTKNISEVGGGIFNAIDGTATITDSSVNLNMANDPGIGGGISTIGAATIINTTLAGNRAQRGAGAIEAVGSVLLINSTISGNRSGDAVGGVDGNAGLENTILAMNVGGVHSAPDCAGNAASFGNNVIGNTTRCAIALQNSDIIGDPGLDAFTDDGTPGNGHFDLLPTSPAIDAGNHNVCPKTDQLGRKRGHVCDIGAIEFRGREVTTHEK